jgi:hypothetical protein
VAVIKPIYSSQAHSSIIDTYLTMCKQFSQEVANESRYNNYLDVVELILEYHNEYGKDKERSFYDWLMIIPINLSCATNGFFAGIETKSNSAEVRAYKNSPRPNAARNR